LSMNATSRRSSTTSRVWDWDSPTGPLELRCRRNVELAGYPHPVGADITMDALRYPHYSARQAVKRRIQRLGRRPHGNKLAGWRELLIVRRLPRGRALTRVWMTCSATRR